MGSNPTPSANTKGFIVNENSKIICRDVYGKEYETTLDSLSFRPAVYGIIVKDAKILLSRQDDGYDFPGGGIELGESIENALIREVKEETGLDVKVGKLLTCQDSFFKFRNQERYVHSILLYHLCEITGGNISIDLLTPAEKEYVKEPEWLSFAEAKKAKFYNAIDNVKLLKEIEKITPNKYVCC